MQKTLQSRKVAFFPTYMFRSGSKETKTKQFKQLLQAYQHFQVIQVNIEESH